MNAPNLSGIARCVPLVRVLSLVCAMAALAGCSSTSPTSPSGTVTLLVDPTGAGDYTTIQAALNVADSGDTVLVLPGTYTGPSNRDLDFGGENIVLMAASARDSVVIDCEGEGRGFYLHSGEGPASIIDGFIVVNGQGINGGGAHFDGASPTIRNLVFRENAAEQDGGGMYLKGGSAPSLTNVSFEQNAAGLSGGGLACDRNCEPTISHVDFTENEASSGGGMSCVFSDPVLFEVTFIRNAASSAGGGLHCAGSSPTIDEVTFLANSTRHGGALALDGSSPSLSHATIANNEAILGGGIYCANSSSPVIRTSIIALNLGGGAVYCAGGDAPNTQKTCLYGNFGGDTPCGTHADNIYLDPLFCDLGGDDLTLCANSPCLPAGNDWGLRLGDRGQGCGDCDSSLGVAPWRTLRTLPR